MAILTHSKDIVANPVAKLPNGFNFKANATIAETTKHDHQGKKYIAIAAKIMLISAAPDNFLILSIIFILRFFEFLSE